MKTKISISLLTLLAIASGSTQAAPLGTAFTYQGCLNDRGDPANGTYDLRFELFDASTSGSQIGLSQTNPAVGVSNGLFTTTLDFGGGVFTGEARWLEIGVRTNGGSAFTRLTPRQPLPAAPYALHAPSAGWAAGATIASGVAAEAVGTAGLQSGAVTSDKIASGAVGGTQLATHSIGSTHLQSGSVAADQLGAAAVGTTAIAANAVTASKLAKQLSVTSRLVLTNRMAGTKGGLGYALSFGGGVAGLAGLPFEPSPSSVGVVYLDLNADGSWGMTLTNPYPASGDRFGHSVLDVPPESALIGSPGDNAGAGGVHRYNLGAQVWEEHFLNPTANPIGDEFGHALFVLAGLAVGAPFDSDNVQGASHAGAVHVFPYGGGTRRTVTSSQPSTNGNFGYALAGLWVGPSPLWVVGEPFLNEPSRPGVVQLFQNDDWTWLRSVTNPVAQLGDQFGYAVAAFGNDMFIVGAPRGGGLGNGKVCVFRSDGTLVLSVKSDNPEVAGFGKAVAAIGTDYFAVGAPETPGRNGTEVGCVFVYRRDGALEALLEHPSRDEPGIGDEHFGHALAWSPGHLYIGAPGANVGDGAIHDYSLLEWMPGIVVGNVLDGTITSSKLGAGAVTAAKLGDGATLSEIADDDGAGSGLDADLLDGQHAADFAAAAHHHDTQYVNEGQSESVTGSMIVDGTIGAQDIVANTFWSTEGNTGTTNSVNFLGTADHQALELKVNNQRALRLEPNSYSPNVIGGFSGNFVGAGVYGATIGGGGNLNYNNTILATYATIAGGHRNTIGTNSSNSAIGGGYANAIGTNCGYSAIGGGYDNNIATDSWYATIAGGIFNDIATNSGYSTIGGGNNNNIAADSSHATIAGGILNDIDTNSVSSAIGGGYNNNIAADSHYATVAGGYINSIGTNSDDSAIGGGSENHIAADSKSATIAGGNLNDIGANSRYSTIGGGYDNNIGADSTSATIAGGIRNDIGTNSRYSTIGGGYDNHIAADSYYPAIAGGNLNDIGTNSDYSAIGGGSENHIAADSHYAAIAGGKLNDIGTNTRYCTIGGGFDNHIAADSMFATIPGGADNSATNYAFAAGLRAKANHKGSFVWGDSSSADVASATANSVTMRASGGYRFFADSLATVGVSLGAGDNAWSPMSDRNVKENFRPIDPRGILEKVVALPVTEWNLISQPAEIRHLGPMAQDFKAAFGLGVDDRHISTVDADGVALAAIQGLNEKVESGKQKAESRIVRLEAENAELGKQVAELKAQVETLMEKVKGGAP